MTIVSLISITLSLGSIILNINTNKKMKRSNHIENKLAKTTAIIGLALGSGVIGYAASNAFQDLDTIKANFNTVLQYGQTKSQRVSELESQLSNNILTQEQLKAEIEQIKSDKQKEIEQKATGD